MDSENLLGQIDATEAEAKAAWMSLTGPDASLLDVKAYKILEDRLFAAQACLPMLRKRLLDQTEDDLMAAIASHTPSVWVNPRAPRMASKLGGAVLVPGGTTAGHEALGTEKAAA